MSSTGRVRQVARRTTPGRRVDPRLVEDALTEAVAGGRGRAPDRRVSVSQRPASWTRTGERVRFAPHLPWRGEEVRARLMERWGATGGARQRRQLRRSRRGRRSAPRAARPTRSWSPSAPASAAPSCSAAGCIRGSNGMAGEFGHMQVVPDGQAVRVRRHGCWEQYSSGNALVRYARARIGSSRPCRGAVWRQPGAADRPDGHRGRRGRRPGGARGVRTRSASGSGSASPTWSRPSTPRSW